MLELELLGRKILAMFLATAYLAEKMSTILVSMSAAHPRCYLGCQQKQQMYSIP